jgi:hypothetical protein
MATPRQQVDIREVRKIDSAHNTHSTLYIYQRGPKMQIPHSHMAL